MNDEHMDDLIRRAARDYNEPGPVPREQMWSGIARARTPATVRKHGRLWMWPTVGIAAAALLAIGVTIGRRMDRSPTAAPAALPTVAVNPVVVKAHVDSASTDTVVKQLREETRKTDAAVRRVVAQAPSSQAAHTPTRPHAHTPIGPSSDLAYRLVVLRHLAGSEALITSFRTSAKRGEMDAQIAGWARELLGTTRLLESSQASADPVMKRLLEDLDLVIAQIAQYAARGTYNPDELDLIEQSINQRGVISKLRSTTASSSTAHM
jgi:hypothetical protein